MRYFFIILLLALLGWFAFGGAVLDKTIPCDDKKPRTVKVTPGRLTLINFPFRPKDVIPGEAIFDFKQIKNDLVIKALKKSGQTNVVVYLEERRCVFNFITVPTGGDDILIVKDAKDAQYEVKFYE